MNAIMIAVAAGVIVALGFVIYAYGDLKGWWVRRSDLERLIAKLEPHIRVYKPAGPGPFPVVLQLHGCGGAKKIQDEFAEAARDAGVLAVVLDSLTPRKIDFEKALKHICTGHKLRGRERAGDLVAGLEMVRRRPDIDPERIAVAGWSHGGWTIMDLLALDTPREKPDNLRDMPDDPWAGVIAIQLIYPYCGFPALTRSRGWTKTDIPVDALILQGDKVANPNVAQRAFTKARESGAVIDVEKWSGVTHAFEEDMHPKGSRCRYDPVRAKEAHARYAAWLSRIFGSASAETPAEAPAASDAAE